MAARHWKRSLAALDTTGSLQDRIDVRRNLAAAYESLGSYQVAGEYLLAALQIVQNTTDHLRVASLHNDLGVVYVLRRQTDAANRHLEQARLIAEEDGFDDLAAVVRNSMGNLLSASGQFGQAVALYEESVARARTAGNAALVAKGLVNGAVAAGLAGHDAQASDLASKAIVALAAMKDSHDKSYLLLMVGRAYEQLASRDRQQSAANRQHGYESYQQALTVGRAIEDRRAQSYALGYLGHLYEAEGRGDEAVALTAHAIFLAQQIQDDYALYQWQWQAGRLLRTQRKTDEAIAAYRRAAATLDRVRVDVAVGFGNRPSQLTFHQNIGPMYLELADLLLQRAATLEDQSALQQAYLREARDAAESLRTAELTDYFRDECVSYFQAGIEGLLAANKQGTASNTAIIYVVPLPDRVEILISLATGMERFVSKVGSSQLTDEVRSLRLALVDLTEDGYFAPAQQLYQWLIAPAEATLKRHDIHTLVFVPDGALRTIPFAVLYDGKSFLIDRYAVAITPGLKLMAPRPMPRDKIQVLIGGLSEARLGAPALPFVPYELEQVQKIYGGTPLIDKDFRAAEVKRQLEDTAYNIVHIASHGHFSSDVDDTYILTYDQKLKLNALEKLIRPSQFRGEAVELLTLSACQTAAGDDRAALGLAGVAVKAGARSALATLWTINDKASATLIADFYRRLHDEPSASKAQALQEAQNLLRKDPRYQHPGYWSPFLIIGNWM